MSSEQIPRLSGIKELAEHFCKPAHSIDYIVRSRGIEAKVRVAGVRLFHRDQLPEIAAALADAAKPRPSVRNAGWDLLVDELCEGENDAA